MRNVKVELQWTLLWWCPYDKQQQFWLFPITLQCLPTTYEGNGEKHGHLMWFVNHTLEVFIVCSIVFAVTELFLVLQKRRFLTEHFFFLNSYPRSTGCSIMFIVSGLFVSSEMTTLTNSAIFLFPRRTGCFIVLESVWTIRNFNDRVRFFHGIKFFPQSLDPCLFSENHVTSEQSVW